MFLQILVLIASVMPMKNKLPWFYPNLRDSVHGKIQTNKEVIHYPLMTPQKLHSKETLEKSSERRLRKDEVMIDGKRYRRIEKGNSQVLILVNEKESEEEIERKGMELLNGQGQKGGDTLGYITGTVADTAGNPIQGIGFWVTNLSGNYWYASSSWETDSLGHYIIAGVDWPIEFDSCKIQTDNSIGYINEWWNNKQNSWDADTIVVAYPDTLKNIDFQLKLGGIIAGQITDTTGIPISGIDIAVYDTNYNRTGSASSNDSGYYYVNGLASGAYKLRTYNNSGYIDEWWNDKPDINSADTVGVNAPDTTQNIDFQLKLGGVIAGQITDTTGTPISRIYIAAYDTNYSWTGYASSNDSGYYYINGLASGEYKLHTYNNSGYIDEWWNDKPDFNSADTVGVNTPDTTQNIDFQLKLGGVIAGQITDTTGTPISRIYITVYDTNYNRTGYASSNDSGYYYINGLASGAYKLQTYNNSGYIDEWYNDKTDFNSADTIWVNAPDTTQNIDFRLKLGGVIAGQITDTTGTPISGIYITAYDTNYSWTRYASSNDSGYYYVNGLASGAYKLQTWNNSGYIDEWWNDKPDFNSADTVWVNAPDTTQNINFYLGLSGIQEKPTKSMIKFALQQNRPNPFINTTTITFSIPKNSNVSIRIYNICGQVINTLLNEKKSPGTYSVKWNGKNKKGKKLPAGIYFYRVEAGNLTATRKFIMLE